MNLETLNRKIIIIIIRNHVGKYTSARVAGKIADMILALDERRRLQASCALWMLVDHLRNLSGSAEYVGDPAEALDLIQHGEAALEALKDESTAMTDWPAPTTIWIDPPCFETGDVPVEFCGDAVADNLRQPVRYVRIDVVEERIAAARAEEREACAEIADQVARNAEYSVGPHASAVGKIAARAKVEAAQEVAGKIRDRAPDAEGEKS